VRHRPGQDPLAARDGFMAEARARGLSFTPYPGPRVRALTHYGIGRTDIQRALTITRESLVATGLAAMTM
jgi:hypothetical protein